MTATEPIRLLLMIDDGTIGGGPRHVCDLVAGLDRERYDVAVAGAAEGYLAERLAELGVPLHPIRLANRPDAGAYRRCLEILAATRAQLLHTHGGTAGFTGRLAARRARLRTVHTYHGLHYLHFRGWRRALYETTDRLFAPRTDRIICVAESDLRLAERHGLVRPGRAAVVRNGIDAEPFFAIERRAGAGGTGREDERERGAATGADGDATGLGMGPVIGTIGRLHRQKGHRDLIAAAAIVVREEPACRFVIVGEGKERVALELEIAAAGLAHHVTLAGRTHDAVAALASFDLFVLPSLWEGLPLTLLEAMAAGLPVVASDVDGIPEALGDPPVGRLVPPRDPERLATALLELLRDRDAAARLGEAGRRRVREQFTLARMVRETQQVYAAALGVGDGGG